MSIFKQIIILFIASLSLMIFVSNETNAITQSKIELLLKEKYQQSSVELFKYLSNNDKNGLNKKLKELNFSVIDEFKSHLLTSTVIYENTTSFGEIKILLDKNERYLLFLSYLDETLLVQDMAQEENFSQKSFLGYLIFADIFILGVIFLLILKILFPLKKISKNIKEFGDGNLHVRMENLGHNELGELTHTFNDMAENIEALIHARQRLLRDIGHELRTPIAKSKLALEMIGEGKYQKILKRAIVQIDEMTGELLNIEKLNANVDDLVITTFNVETLISEALSKLFMEDETAFDMVIDENFNITADLNYLSIALKNLMDNALKYATQKPIVIEVKGRTIFVKSQGVKLEHDLAFYCEAFAQGDNSRNQEGFGLGLSIVKKILDKHGFKMSLTCKEGWNSFNMVL